MPDLHFRGDAAGDIQQVPVLDELIRPDDIDHGRIVGGGIGSHPGHDLVVDVVVADVFHDDLDVRILGFKVAGDLIDLGRLHAGLIHGEHVDGDRSRGRCGFLGAAHLRIARLSSRLPQIQISSWFSPSTEYLESV